MATGEEYRKILERLNSFESWESPLSEEQYEILKRVYVLMGEVIPIPERLEENQRITRHLLDHGLDCKWLVSYADLGMGL